MPGPTAWGQTAFVYGSANQTITTTSELVVCTLAAVNSRGPGFPVNLNGWVVVSAGTSTTAIVIRVRQDSLTGSVVGSSSTDSAVPATLATAQYGIEVQDTPTGEYAGKTYVLTVQQTSAAGNGTVVAAALSAVF